MSEHVADVLVVGGGPAAAWAALKAAGAGLHRRRQPQRRLGDVLRQLGGGRRGPVRPLPRLGPGRVTGAGGAGLRPTGGAGSAAGPGEARELVRLVQEQVLPYDKNHLRRGSVLTGSLGALDEVWAQLRSLRGEDAGLVKVRQAAAMTAHARWMYASALARTESRGMARRLDHPGQDPAQHHRIVTGGLDRVWTRPAELVA